MESKKELGQGCLLSQFSWKNSQRIKNTNSGIYINEEKLSILLFADDVVILANSKEEMQQLIDQVSRFSRELDVKFSKEKCMIMEIDTGEHRENSKIMLNDVEMLETKKYKYLGLELTNKGLETLV